MTARQNAHLDIMALGVIVNVTVWMQIVIELLDVQMDRVMMDIWAHNVKVQNRKMYRLLKLKNIRLCYKTRNFVSSSLRILQCFSHDQRLSDWRFYFIFCV